MAETPAQIMGNTSGEESWSQIVTSSKKFRGEKYLPYAFTEQGVTMLSSVLRSEKAIQVNIAIMRERIMCFETTKYHNP